MFNWKKTIAITITLLVLPVVIFAAQSTFEIRLTTTGFDSTAPSIPTNLVATAVSTSQIDLTWTASTDDTAVFGYRIFRDGLFLATTSTLTTYSDTGLTANTTYAYTVEAFDQSYNLSGQSATSSATTFAEPVVVVPPPTTTGGGSGGALLIYSVETVPGLKDATVSFKTTLPAQSKISWGRTTDYELGSLVSLFYGYDHELQITGLESNTNYYVKIEAVSTAGITAAEYTSFKTKTPVGISPLPNPNNFTATPSPSSIDLTWKNPVHENFDSVIIVRSEEFFPKDQFDGKPIYQGKAESFKDINVVPGKTYYYAIFSKGINGEFSSGAIAQAKVPLAGETPTKVIDPFANLPDSELVDEKINDLTFGDFEFIQEGKILTKVNNVVAINGIQNLTIRLKYEKVPEILKTIAVTLIDPEDSSKIFPFILRVNEDKSYFTATIGALGRSGNYGVRINILDYKNQALKRLNGDLRALVFSSLNLNKEFDFAFLLFLAILILISLVAMYVLNRHGKRRSAIAAAIAFTILFGTLYIEGSKANAAVFNPQINYQGKLTGTTNIAVPDGFYSVRFRLYTSLTGGSPIWTEIWCSKDDCTGTGAGVDNRIRITNGLFSTMLGSTTAFTGIDFNQPLYLGVEIGGSAASTTWDGEMSPRKILGAVPAAFIAATSTYAGTSSIALSANTLQNLTPGQFIRSDTTNSTSTANTFLSIIQSGAGRIAEFIGQSSQSVLALMSTGNVGIGTSTPAAKLSISGNKNETNANLFMIASTTDGTSTTTLFAISNSGTTTAANGFNITAGCYALNGSCISTGSNLTGGSVGALTYWTSGTTVGATTSPTVGYITATTTATSTFTGGIATDLLRVSSTTASSTFANGINITAGCYALNGACVGGSNITGSGSPNTLTYWTSTGAIGATTSPTVGYIVATSTTASQLPYASSTALTLTGQLFAGADSPGTAGQVLQSTGTGIQWVASTTLSTITGTLSVAKGGTGSTSFIPLNLLWYDGTNITSTSSQLTVGNIYSSSTATSTFTGGLSADIFRASSTTASSTFANGINLQAGCYAINGACVGGSGITGSGSPNTLTYWTSTGGIGATTSPAVGFIYATSTTATSTFAGYLNVLGTTSTSTFSGFLSAGSTTLTNLVVTNTSTSTLAGGLQISSGGLTLGTFNCSAFNNNGKLTTDASGNVICSNDLSGSGSGGGTWSTTTSQVAGQLVNYPNNNSDIVAIGNNSTTTAKYWFDPNALVAYLGGNVGIGTTSPYRALSVYGSSDLGTNALAGTFTATTTTGTSTFAGGLTAASNFYVLQNGSVGIGTSNPAQALSVTGNQTVSGFLDAGSYRITGGSVTGAGVLTASGALLQVGSSGQFTSGVSLNASGVEILRAINGRVGIGTTSPGWALSVVGTTTAAVYIATTTATSTFAGDLDVRAIRTTASSTLGAGINIESGCYAINGSCVGGSGITGSGSPFTLTYWTSTGSIGATTSPTVGYITATSTTASSFINASTTNLSIGGSLFAQNSPGTGGYVLQSTGSGIQWVATTTYSGALVYAGGNVTCQAASASQNGCLSNLDFSAFNAKAGSTTNTFSGLQQMLAGASTTALSVYTNIWVGGSATTTIQGNTNGTSTFSGALGIGTSTVNSKVAAELLGTDTYPNIFTLSSSTAAGVVTTLLNVSASGSTTVSNGINITAGCYALNGSCIGGSNITGSGSPNTLTYWTSTGAIGATTSPTVGYIVASSTTATSTFAGGLFVGTSSPNFVVDNYSGRVGIGTLNPASSLQIASGQVLLPNGAVGAPALSFSTDTDTGIYTNSGHLFLTAGGVAIADFHDGSTAMAIRTGSVSLNGGQTIFSFGSNDLTIDNTGTKTIIADGLQVNGNVGFGSSTPSTKLVVAGTTTVAVLISTTTATSTFAGGIDISSGCYSLNGVCVGGSGITGSGSPNTLTYWTSTGSIGATTSPTVGYLISTSSTASTFVGNVGVGTSTPWAKLAVLGNVGDTNTNLFLVASSTDGTATSAPVFLVNSLGRVGIGTTSPAATLGITGTAFITAPSATGVALTAVGGGSSIQGGIQQSNGTRTWLTALGNHGGGDGSSWYLRDTTAGFTRLVVNSSGSVGIGTTSPYRTLSIHGSSDLGTNALAGSFTATSTATSTFAGGILVDLIRVSSSTASSTFANGINIEAGCYAINGACVGGSGITGSGSPNTLTYWTGTGSLSATGTPTVTALYASSTSATSTFMGALAIGTSTIWSKLSLVNTSGDNNPYSFVIASTTSTGTTTTHFAVTNTGNVGVGTTSPTDSFAVNASAYIGGNLGLGVVATTTKLTINSGSSELPFRIQGPSSRVDIGLSSNLLTIRDGSNAFTFDSANRRFSYSVSSGGTQIDMLANNTGYGFLLSGDPRTVINTPVVDINGFGTLTTTSGTSDSLRVRTSFAPTSGTAEFNGIQVASVINQSAGGSGISRGIYINPTLTSPANWRSLEIVPNSGYGIYQSGSAATNYFAGNVGIGSSSPSTSLVVSGTTTVSVLISTTTATSTFGGGLELTQIRTTASSTLGAGINIQAGCFAINNVCQGGSNITGSGSPNTLTYWTSTGSIGATTSPAVGYIWATSTSATSTFMGALSIGTTTPWAKLSLVNTGTDNNPYSFLIASTTSTGTTTTHFVVSNTGNVGIGTTSPAQKLDVAGDIRLGAAGSNATISFQNTTSNFSPTLSSNFGSNTFTMSIGGTPSLTLSGSSGITMTSGVNGTTNNSAHASGFHAFQVNTLEVARIVNGAVGIGTTTPFAKLSISGNKNESRLNLFTISSTTDGTSTTTLFNISNSGSTTAANGFNITAGCFAINDVCQGGSNITGSGSPNTLTYWTDTGSLGATTSPTVGYLVASSTTGTSTFAGGVYLRDGSTAEPALSFASAPTTGFFRDTGTGNLRVLISGSQRISVSSSAMTTAVGGGVSIRLGSSGSASTPVYSFETDENTGMYRSAADTLGFSTGGLDRLTIDSSGNVGIGTTSPGWKLSVNGVTAAASFIATTTATSTFAGGIFVDSLRVSSSTASSTFANGLNIEAGCYAINNVCVGGSGITGSGSPNTLTYWTTTGNLSATGTPTVSSLYASSTSATSTFMGALAIGTSTIWSKFSLVNTGTDNNPYTLVIASSTASGTTTTHFVVTNSGNVGIGTSTPAANLALAGNAYITGGLGVNVVNSTAGRIQTAENIQVDGGYVGNLLSGSSGAKIRFITATGATNNSIALSRADGAYGAVINMGNGSTQKWGMDLTGEYFLMKDRAGTNWFQIGSSNSATNDAGNVNFQVGSSLYTALSISSTTLNVGIGTTTPFAKFSIVASSTDTNANVFLISSTTVAQTGTTTLFAISNTGSTTAANGFNITNGCYALNGACVGGSNITGSGSPFTLTYWTETGSIGATTSPTVGYLISTSSTASTFVGNVGIGTSSPYAALSVVGEIVGSHFTGTTTATSTLGGHLRVGNPSVSATGSLNPALSVRQIGTGNLSEWYSSANTLLSYIGSSGEINSVTGAFYDTNVTAATNVAQVFRPDQNYIGVMSDHQLVWRSVASGGFFSAGSIDTGLARDSAGALRVTNGAAGGGSLKADFFTATSTATSTFTGGLSADIFRASSTTASSTFANGINLQAGCFAVNNVCVGSGASLSGGSPNTLTYWTSATTVGATSSPTLGYIVATTTTATSTFAGVLAVGTTSPFLSPMFVVGTTTPNLYVSSTTGNVGIGTSSPRERLEVENGNILFAGAGNASPVIRTDGTFGPRLVLDNDDGHISASRNDVPTRNYVTFGLLSGVKTGAFTQAGGMFGWTNSSTDSSVHSTVDTAFTRLSANKVALGNSVTGNFGGTLIANSIGLGTSTPFAKLSIVATSTETFANLFLVASTTDGTSTTTLFNISNTGSTTAANGFNITAGCYAVSGVCLSSNATLSGGSPNTLTYWVSGTTVGATSSPTVGYIVASSTTATSTFAGAFSVGSSTPANNNLFSVGTSTPLLVVDNFNGHVGIGTSNPLLAALDVNGQVRVARSTNQNTPVMFADSENTGIALRGNSNNVVGVVIGGSSSFNFASFDLRGYSASTIGWSSTAAGTGWAAANDVAFSRLGANKVALGSGNVSDFTGTLIAGAIGLGTSTPFAKLSILSTSSDSYANLFMISSSTAAFATSTLFAISNTGSTTAANGFNITAGCYAVSGVCLSSNATLSGGSPNTLVYWTSETTVGATTSPTVGYITSTSSTASTFVGNVGIGTTSPSAKLSVSTAAQQDGTLSLFAVASTTNTNILTIAGNASTILNTNTSSFDILNSTGRTWRFSGGNLVPLTTGVSNLGGTSQVLNAVFTNFASTTNLSSTGSVWLATTGGNVGIGTTSPFAKLSVSGNVGDTNSILFLVSSSTDGTATSAPVFLVNNLGRVGIGTSSPAATLDTYGTTSVAYGIGQQFMSGLSGTNTTYKNVFQGNISTDYTRLALFNAVTTITGTVASPLTFKLTSTGDMTNGFGPGFLYAIQDTAGVENFIARTAGVRNGADNTGAFQIDVSNSGTLGTVATFLANGNVGIGTTSPYSKLSVAGQVVAENYIATGTATSTFTGGLSADIFRASSTTASSTFANGINLQNGCFAVNNTCITNGAASLSGGSPNTLTFWTSGTTVSATGSPAVGYITATSTVDTSRFAGGVSITGLSDNGIIGPTGLSLLISTTTSEDALSGITIINTVDDGGSDTSLYGIYVQNNSTVSAGGFSTALSGKDFNISAGISTGVYGYGNNYGGLFENDTSNHQALHAEQKHSGGWALYSIGAKNYFNGNVGIGTTSPYARLAILATTTIGTNTHLIYVASSTADNATSTHLVLTNTGLFGLGTTTPYRTLSVYGSSDLGNDALAGSFTATSSLATSTFAGGAIFSNGTVLIGTTTPTDKSGYSTGMLTVDGMLDIPSTDGSHKLQIGATGTGTWVLRNSSAGTILTFSTGNVLTVSQPTIWGAYSGIGTGNRIAVKATDAVASTHSLDITDSNNMPLFRVNNAGRIGIGTTTPFAKLSIHATSSDTNTNIFLISSSTAAWATSTLFAITNTGSTTAANGFNISDGCYAIDGACIGTGQASLSGGSPNTLVYWTSETTVGATTSPTVGYITATSSTASTFMGNVGVGSSSPQWKLTVSGTMPSFGLSDSSAPAGLKNWLMSSINGNFYLGTTTDQYATSSVSALTILNNGHFGIGTSSPAGTLAIRGLDAAKPASGAFNASTTIFAQGGTGSYTNGSAGGAGGGFVFIGGAGASTAGASQTNVGGVGGSFIFTAGDGGLGSDAVDSTTGGHGGQLTFTSGTGGAVTTGAPGTGGRGGNIIFATGAGGIGDDVNGVYGNILFNASTTNGGNVGIGTSTPWAKLAISVASASSTNNNLFLISSSTVAGATTTSLILTNTGFLGLGTTTPYRTLSVYGSSDLGTNALAGSFTGTSTATSTLVGGLSADIFRASSTTASSTFANGINLQGGCFAINNTCVGGGQASLSGGSPNTLVYWTSGTTVGATTSPTVGYLVSTSSTASTFAGAVAIGTDSPSAQLEVNGDIAFTRTTGTRTLKVEGPAVDVNGGTLALEGADGNVNTGDSNGGGVNIRAGNGDSAGTSATGGNITITAGNASRAAGGATNGGNVSINSGAGAGTNDTFGNISLEAGGDEDSDAGYILLGSVGLAKVGIGTTTPYRALSVYGSSDLGTNALAGSFTGTSTATSTFGGGLELTQIRTTASSTLGAGINIQSGCFAVNNVCVGSGGPASLSGGSPNTLTYWTSDTTVGATSSPTIGWLNATSTDGLATSTFMHAFAIGTSSPRAAFTVVSNAVGNYPYAMLVASTTAAGGFIPRFAITNDGNVGIGTSSPQTTLNVAGRAPTIRIDDQNFAPNNSCGFFGQSNTTFTFGVNRNVSTGVFCNTSLASAQMNMNGANGDANIIMYTTNTNNTNGTQRFKITNIGKVSIGTSDPNYNFEVQTGNARVAGLLDAQFFVATTTNATSSFAGYINVNGLVSTSTFLAGLYGKTIAANTMLIGTSATTTIQGATTGTSTIQGFINVLGTNSTSTFSGDVSAVAIRTTASSTLGAGINIEAGCFAINNTCVGGGDGPATLSGGSPNTLAFWVSETELSATTSPTVGYIIATSSTVSTFAGGIGIGTSTPFAVLGVNGVAAADSFVAYNAAATSTFAGGLNVGQGALTYNFSNSQTSISSLQIGALNFDTNAGLVSWADLPVTSSAAVGTAQGFVAQINGNQLLTVYAQSDGAGGIQRQRVLVGTTTDAILGSSNIPDGSLIVGNGALCVQNSASSSNCSSSARRQGVIYAQSASVTALDLAEQYPTTDTTLEAGELLMVDPMNSEFVKRFDANLSSTTPSIIGVVSTAPGLLLGGFNGNVSGAKNIPVALAGRVPIKVNLEGGPIAIGDRLAPSSIPGVAKKATETGYTVGTALEAVSTLEEGQITSISGFVDRIYNVVSPTQALLASASSTFSSLVSTSTESGSASSTTTTLASISGPSATQVALEALQQQLTALATSSAEIANTTFALASTTIELASTTADLASTTANLASTTNQIAVRISNVETLLGIGTSSASSSVSIASSTISTSTPFMQALAGAVKSMIQSAGNWMVDTFSAKIAYIDRVEAKVAAVSQGLEMTDQATGQIYCVVIRNGNWDKVPGACTTSTSASSTTTVASSTPDTNIPPTTPAVILLPGVNNFDASTTPPVVSGTESGSTTPENTETSTSTETVTSESATTIEPTNVTPEPVAESAPPSSTENN